MRTFPLYGPLRWRLVAAFRSGRLTGVICPVTRQAGRNTMRKLAIWAQLEAKPGKEKEVEEFLKSAQPLAERETATISWYAIKMGPGKYGIFDTFADENGRNAHL